MCRAGDSFLPPSVCRFQGRWLNCRGCTVSPYKLPWLLSSSSICFPSFQCALAVVSSRLSLSRFIRTALLLCAAVVTVARLAFVSYIYICAFPPLANNQCPINSKFLIVCSSCQAPCSSKEWLFSVFLITNGTVRVEGHFWLSGVRMGEQDRDEDRKRHKDGRKGKRKTETNTER